MRRLALLFCLALLASGCAKRNWSDSRRLETLHEHDEYSLEHVIAPGESLTDVCELYYGDADRRDEVARANGLVAPEHVAVGTRVRLVFTEDEWWRADARRQALEPYNEGVAALRDGRSAAAEDAFHRALTLDPDFDDAQYNLAIVLLQRGRFQDAAAMLLPLVDRRPDDVEARVAYGRALHEQERYDEAVAAYAAVLARDPDHEEAGFARAAALERAGRRAEALEAWDAFLARHVAGLWADRARARRALLRAQDP